MDFLVEFEGGRSLFELIRLKYDLEDLLGRPVDVVAKESLNWRIRDDVTMEVCPL